jgi:predicted anti-sigma-YlaC factor YlaD
MECSAARNLLFRKIDHELSGLEESELDAHLTGCPSCTREYRLLALPGRIARTMVPLTPSPYFYSKLKTELELENKKAAGWQVFFGLARQVIPALAGITLALISIFAYHQLSAPETDLSKSYYRVFVTEDQPHRMLFSNGDLTDESVLIAIAERDRR